MSNPVEVTDPRDPRLVDFWDLKRADRRPDRPGGRGLVIAEGTVVVRRMIDSPYRIRALLGVRRRFDELADDLAATEAPYYVADAEIMDAAVGFHLNRGVLATADRAARPDVARLLEMSRTVAVLEGVGDHENVGSVFRNAAALGIDAVLLAGGCADPLYRRSVRVSMGNVLAVPFAAVPPLGDGGAEILRAHGFRTVAMTPRRDAPPLGEHCPDRAGSAERVAIVLGSEGPGLTGPTLAACDETVRIPMTPGVDSLNVATAGAIAFAHYGHVGK